MKLYSWVVVALLAATISLPVCAQEKSQYANIETKNSNGEVMLLGHCDWAMLKQGTYQSWFMPGFNAYQPDSIILQSIKPLLQGKQIEIFLGTWCGDSRREVPKMLKLLETAGCNISSVKLVFVSNAPDAYKQSPQHEEAGKDIKRVPTLIVYHDKKETGRIVEYPVVSLEKDLLAILRGEKYVPNYSTMK